MKATRTLDGPGLYILSVRSSGEFRKALGCEETQEVPRTHGRSLGGKTVVGSDTESVGVM